MGFKKIKNNKTGKKILTRYYSTPKAKIIMEDRFQNTSLSQYQ